MTLCNYKQDGSRFICRACGDIRKRLVVRECPGEISHGRSYELPAWLTCPHRGAVVATITGQIAGCGCGATAIDVYRCERFAEPVLKQGKPPCLDTLRERVPGATGRTCRECEAHQPAPASASSTTPPISPPTITIMHPQPVRPQPS